MATERATATTDRVINVDFYIAGKLPTGLADEAKRQGFKPERGLVAVKTLIGSPPTYAFEYIGSTPAQVKKYMFKLAKADGTDLSEAVKAAFSD